MNILSFTVEPLGPPAQMASAAVPLIDGTRLTDLIERFEKQKRLEPTGGYSGLVFEFFNSGPLQKYFGCIYEAESANSFLVLACECGELVCWPLKCHVRRTHDLMVWEQFSQPHRPERDDAEFGPFTFSIDQYEAAIAQLRATLRVA